MATFAGIQLGTVSECYDVPNPVRWQLNAYPGANGRERINLGTDGGRIEVLCKIEGASLGDLLSFERTFYGYQAAGTGWSFQNNLGAVYESVVLTALEPLERIKSSAGGGWFQSFRLTFEYDA